MIVRETPEHFIFITQHDHAYISGELFSNFKKEFVTIEHYESLKFAIHQHDRAWMIPDAEPILNDTNNMPFTFMDYPERLKLHFYKLGIDQIDLANSYAAILCSMHNASFYANTQLEFGKQFFEREKLRQKHLINKLKIPHDRLLNYQLRILQFCDDLSLYICLNRPCVAKEEEIPLFKNGFPKSEFFHENGKTKVMAYYRKHKNMLRFNSSPFQNTFNIRLPHKSISKKLIREIGLAKAYEMASIDYYTINVK